ncbi:hypothetical protein [Butyrivibrio sp. YAB3001]|uniref:hypothetical protein n=1 Tax=Butyrivibrio sp. YAB3001 TaxID=1520812 RepID=UPI0008F67BD7|nr:hypothetical protein [Butyrivibrio sp. YAB3001]SFD03772.1 hypothetical protein SAMN02910398_03856 [Butyrivibrio sp. YAB3001]
MRNKVIISKNNTKWNLPFIFIILATSFFTMGCGKNSEDRGKYAKSSSVEEVLFQQISDAEKKSSSNDEVVDEAVIDDSEIDTDDMTYDSDSSSDSSIVIGESNVGIDDELITDVQGPEENTGKDKKSDIDVDLTALSSTMVYSEVYSMMINPENYIGKTVKMKGQFVPYLDESTGKYYFACFISDAMACCSQGIEFVLTEDYSYPDDYPSEGDTICVIGTFDTYMEGENMYCTLRGANITSLK